MSMALEAGAWQPGRELEHEATALRGWYLSLAQSIRHVQPAPPPEDVDARGVQAGLRRLDAAVQADDTNEIRAALGVTLAEEAISSLRELEGRLARALDDLTSDARARTPDRNQTAPRLAA